jgi:hypothetical protein
MNDPMTDRRPHVTDPSRGLAPPGVEDRLARLGSFARLMDSQFRIPGTPIRMGLDGLIGLIPGVGDVATTLMASYVFAEATALGVRKRVLARMLLNTGVDTVLGAIPVVGDLFDIGFKSNAKNARLVIAEVRGRAERRPR